MSADRGPTFDGIKIGRPATGALIVPGIRRCPTAIGAMAIYTNQGSTGIHPFG